MTCFRSALKAEPIIKKLSDLDDVLAELSMIDHHTSELSSECSREIDTTKQVYQSRMVCQVGRSSISLATRRQQLQKAAESWIRSDLRAHLPEGERSIKLAHGKVGFREQAPRVQYLDGVDEKMAIDRIEQRTGIVASAVALLSKAFSVFTLGQLIRFRPEINKVEIKKAWDAKPDARATLAELGITVQAGEDQIVLEPTTYRVAKPAE